MVGVEQDDLIQEGRLCVITRYMMGEDPTEEDIVNQMRRYIRAIKEAKTVIYEPEIRSLVPLWNS